MGLSFRCVPSCNYAAKAATEGEGLWQEQDLPEEANFRRRQGQEKEVVQRESPGQAEQPDPLRPGHVRQTLQGGAQLQSHHTVSRLRETEDQGVTSQGCPQRTPQQRSNQRSGEAPCSSHLHKKHQGGRRGKRRQVIVGNLAVPDVTSPVYNPQPYVTSSVYKTSQPNLASPVYKPHARCPSASTGAPFSGLCIISLGHKPSLPCQSFPDASKR